MDFIRLVSSSAKLFLDQSHYHASGDSSYDNASLKEIRVRKPKISGDLFWEI